MRIKDLYAQPGLTVSFEFFPPKTAEAEEILFRDTVPALKRLGPGFISVTYGAGGSTRDNTLRIVKRIRGEFGVESMSHLTCVGSTRDMLGAYLDEARGLGIENILALRGDPPKGQTEFKPVAGGFAHAVELIRFVNERNCFSLGGACYPEGHVECGDKKLDWDRAAAKVDAGAQFLITQLFYDWRDFLEMEDYLRNKRGVKVPIVPGVLPFLGTEQIKRFTSLCGAKLADDLRKKLEELAHDDESVRKVGVEVCTEVCSRLIDHGIPGIHFYCLNRVPSCAEIMHNLGVAPGDRPPPASGGQIPLDGKAAGQLSSAAVRRIPEGMHETPSPATPVPPATPPTPGINKSALLIVFLVVFIDLLGFGIVLPLLPRFAEDYVDTLLVGGRENRLGGLIIGLLMSSFSLMQFLFAPVWGRLSDRVGRRPILLIGLGGSVLFYLLFGLALTFPPGEQAGLALALLFAARIGAGIAGATISTAQAVIADSTPPEQRKHGMAIIGAAFGIGFTFGPLIGAAAVAWFPAHRPVIGYFAAGLSLVALILGLRLLPETRRFDTQAVPRRLLNWGALADALRSPAIGPVILTFFLATLGFGAMEATLALVLKDALGLPETRSYLFFAYVGFVLLLTQGFLYRRLARRLTEATFMLLGIVLMACGVGCLGVVSYGAAYATEVSAGLVGLLFFALTTAVVGYAFLTPSAQALVSRRTDASRQGEILGVNQSAAAMARILGPVLGVSLYKLTDNHLWPYALGAALLLLMLPLMPRIRRGADAPTA